MPDEARDIAALADEMVAFEYFFFSSRRRHTISKRDWSSDVCSSDLDAVRDPKHLSNVGLPTELEKFGIAHRVNRHFRIQADWHGTGPVPVGDGAQHLPTVRAVAHEVIVRQRDEVDAVIRPLLQLGDHMRDRFGAHLPPVGDDDVAELALERAPTRRLHTPESILVHFEELDARRRAIAHVDLIGLHVVVAMGALGPVSEELLPGVLAFTLEQYVGLRSASLRVEVSYLSSNVDVPSELTESIRHLVEAGL